MLAVKHNKCKATGVAGVTAPVRRTIAIFQLLMYVCSSKCEGKEKWNPLWLMDSYLKRTKSVCNCHNLIRGGKMACLQRLFQSGSFTPMCLK